MHRPSLLLSRKEAKFVQ
uniref:Uncharacterized protein n=1 Tax=Arundo donax TaxID=35708 RepID=A0A0A9I133_ARUDO